MKNFLRAVAAGLIAFAAVQAHRTATEGVTTLGGEVLLQVTVPQGTPRGDLRVVANTRDVTTAVKPGTHADAFVGLVTGPSQQPFICQAEVLAL